MAVTLLATAAPAPQLMTAWISVADDPPLGEGISFADSTSWIGQATRNATRGDLAARKPGCGVFAILTGLVLTAGSGTTLNVSKGQAAINGIAELAANSTYALPPSTIAYLWLKQNGTLDHTTSTTPPDASSVYLGRVTTSSTVITLVDTTNVVSMQGGIPVRSTADDGMPADTPPAGIVLLTKTVFCDYLWTGASYKQLGIPQVSADPANPRNGDTWFRTDTLAMRVRVAGATKSVTFS